MEVAHYIQRYPPALGGSEAYFARLGRFLAAQGQRVSVFTSNALDLEGFWSPVGRCTAAGTVTEDGVAITRYPLWRMRGRRWLLKPLSFVPLPGWQCLTLPCNPIAFAMWQAAGRMPQRFDLVHASAFPYAFPIACGLRLARRLDVPFLLTPFLHLGDPTNPRDRTRLGYTSPPLVHLLKSAERVFAQTEWEARVLVELGVRQERVVLLGMGVDPAECTGGVRTFARQSWGIDEEEVVIGMLANHSAEKGSNDLLQAAAHLWQMDRRFHIVLAGPEMPSFRKFWARFRVDDAPGCHDAPPTVIGEPGASAPGGSLPVTQFAGSSRTRLASDKRVIRLGVIDDQQRRDFYAGIDLFAFPSRTDSFGLVLLEAWANGVPCVAYRAGGPGEIIRPGEDGLLARCGSVAELAAQLDQLIASADERRRLGHAGSERVRRDMLWPDKLARVARVYAEVTGQAQPGPLQPTSRP